MSESTDLSATAGAPSLVWKDTTPDDERQEQMDDLRERLREYDAATADLDFDTGAGYFRWDIARDELIGVLIGDPADHSSDAVHYLLHRLDSATAEAPKDGVSP